MKVNPKYDKIASRRAVNHTKMKFGLFAWNNHQIICSNVVLLITLQLLWSLWNITYVWQMYLMSWALS